MHECWALGASPDGIVLVPPMETCPVSLQDDNSRQLVPDIMEVKCPFSARGMSIADAAGRISRFPLGKSIDM